MLYFITAIGTDSGKTFVSSIFTEALQADYWKPIQAGLPRDTETVKSLIENQKSFFHSESYLLNMPMSPHAAACADGLEIRLDKILLPTFINDNLIIEGAGGVLVPINDADYVIDIAAKFNAQVILVANIYLGSINHTLLSINELVRRKINIAGIVFNKSNNPESKKIILAKSKLKCLLDIPLEPIISKGVVKNYADKLIRTLK